MFLFFRHFNIPGFSDVEGQTQYLLEMDVVGYEARWMSVYLPIFLFLSLQFIEPPYIIMITYYRLLSLILFIIIYCPLFLFPHLFHSLPYLLLIVYS